MEREAPLKYLHVSLETLEIKYLRQAIHGAFVNKRINSNTTVVVSFVREICKQPSIVDLISLTIQQEGIEHCVCVVNKTFPENYPVPSNITLNFIEHFAVDIKYRRHSGVEFNSQWNPNADRALFLTGKAGKMNRAPLLYKLVKAKLVNQLEYSYLPYNSNNLDINTAAEFKKLFNKDYSKFAKKYARTPDSIADSLINTEGLVSHGYPFNVNLYKNTCLSIIPESEIGSADKIWLTEKTWRAIANCHPFIIVGQTGSLAYLKSLGFRTFESYLLHQDYNRTQNINNLLDQTVENTKFFLNTYKNYEEEINQDVKHNLNTLNKLIQDTINKHGIFQDHDFFYEFFDNTDIAKQQNAENNS